MNNKTELIHTYSIIAIDKENGEMGGAVQSHAFSVGGIVLWAEAGTGVVATQAMVNIEYGPEGLSLMRNGTYAIDAIKILTENDKGSPLRQTALLDSHGNISAFTGSKTIREAGNIIGDDHACQANMMLKDTVWKAMSEAFNKSEGSLAERILIALEAAEKEGGDIRGKQSSALTVVSIEDKGNISDNIILDLRVEDNPEPLKELRRLLNIHKAYNHAGFGKEAVENGDFNKAENEYAIAEKLLPQNIELRFWKACTLVNNKRFNEAEIILNAIFESDPNWKELIKRLPDTDFFKDDADIRKFLNTL